MTSTLLNDKMTYAAVPAMSQRIFRLCWQLETWLRLMVYVELRSHHVDWESPIRKKVRDWPPSSLTGDKRLHHMATAHQASISYLTFGQLWDIISSNENWNLFAHYFPPKANVETKIDEIKTIRNRTAHFREPHANDLARFELFMRDMESGIRKFNIRYTVDGNPKNEEIDSVSTKLAENWDHVGYGVELMRPHGWLYAPGHHRMEPLMNARLAMLFPCDWQGEDLSGVIYRVTVMRGNRNNNRHSNTSDLFHQSRAFHNDIIHFMIKTFGDEVSITIPAILGAERVAELAGDFVRSGLEASRSSSLQADPSQIDWPEYVLWPNHMLNLFYDECHAPILDLD